MSAAVLGEEVLEELQGAGLQVRLLLCDGVAVVGELLLQLLQLLQVLTDLLERFCHCCEPAGGGRRHEEAFFVVCVCVKVLAQTRTASPVLQLVHAGVRRTSDTGDLLPLLPLGQLL